MPRDLDDSMLANVDDLLLAELSDWQRTVLLTTAEMVKDSAARLQEWVLAPIVGDALDMTGEEFLQRYAIERLTDAGLTGAGALLVCLLDLGAQIRDATGDPDHPEGACHEEGP